MNAALHSHWFAPNGLPTPQMWQSNQEMAVNLALIGDAAIAAVIEGIEEDEISQWAKISW